MNPHCPFLTKGIDFVSQFPWAVIVKKHIMAKVAFYKEGTWRFWSGDQLLGVLREGHLTIFPEYACDGFSPTKWVAGHLICITPTPRCGMFPAIQHDFFRQFVEVPGCPYSRKDTDDWFFNSLEAGGVKLTASIYHWFVSGLVGTLFIKITRKQDPKLRIEKI